ncbi:MAG: tRNA 2-thiocytidine(32) synthetase TtcA [Deltaproteobacteria bacterium]|nr:tRNA 2-thiocytidine(32) synthetase TtcA [Deltaproteobacteria bacterium]
MPVSEQVMLIPKSVNRLIGQAMHTYNMLNDGDSVLVAVSGGMDSMTLAAVLNEWRKKAPITYKLTAVHLDMGFAPGSFSRLARQQLAKIGIEVEIESTTFGPDALNAEQGKSGCFHCARKRRSRLFSLAREKGCNKLALGHHKEDIIETFFLNLLYSGNISTMVPSQPLFNGKLTVIRPFAFLDKQQVGTMAEAFNLQAVENPCPLAGTSKRERVRKILSVLTNEDAQIKGNIFSALSNVRNEYLLRHPVSS